MSISDNYAPTRQLGNGATTIFTSTWDALNVSFVKVYFEDVTTGSQTLQSSGFTVAITSTQVTVTFSVAPTSANYVITTREVTRDQTVPFRTSKGFQGANTESAYDKLTAIAQEQQNELGRGLAFPLGSSFTGTIGQNPVDDAILAWDGTSGNTKNGVSVASVATDKAAAEAAATAAALSETNAASSASSASASASTASTAAAAASSSATAAAGSASTASTSASAASSSATASAASETAAVAAEGTAATAATNAASSETNAATSETNAADSASAAATSETNAATSETNAATSATAAATSETNAATSATAAATSETNAATSATAAAVAMIEWQGVWSSATTYALNDAVEKAGTSYICIQAHSNQSPPNVTYWDILAAKGTDGAGAGDLLAANNLSDLSNAATARNNLGIGAVGVLNAVKAEDLDFSTLTETSNTQSADGVMLSVDATTGEPAFINISNFYSQIISDNGISDLAFKSNINNSDWSGTDLSVANGGTNSSNAAGARTNLGINDMGTLNKASQAQAEAGTLDTVGMTPLRTKEAIDALAGGSEGKATAWVNFNGTGTVAIRDSFNVSSITDDATGQYRMNFATAMANANYVVATSGNASNNSAGFFLSSPGNVNNNLTTAARLTGANAGYSTSDLEFAFAVIFGGN